MERGSTEDVQLFLSSGAEANTRDTSDYFSVSTSNCINTTRKCILVFHKAFCTLLVEFLSLFDVHT